MRDATTSGSIAWKAMAEIGAHGVIAGTPGTAATRLRWSDRAARLSGDGQLPRLGNCFQLQLRTVPARQFSARDVGALQERHERVLRVISSAHSIVWQQELAHLRAPETRLRRDRRLGKPIGLRVHVGVEGGIVDRTAAGPESAGPVLLVFRDPVDIAARRWGSQFAIVSSGSEIERAPEPVHRARLASEPGAMLRHDACGRGQNAPPAVDRVRIIARVAGVLLKRDGVE